MFEPTGSRKRVRFSTFSTLILTEPRTREEVNATWYTRRELAEFKRNGRMAVRVERKIAEILCRLIALKTDLIAQDRTPRSYGREQK